MKHTEGPYSIAIIGGGLTGLSLLVGLLKRNIDAKIYEQASTFTEIGAGINFGPNAVRAMKALHPQIYDAFEKVVVRITSSQPTDVYFDWIDGYRRSGRGDEWLFDIRQDGFSKDEKGGGAHRAKFLAEMIKLVPEDRASFGRHLDDITLEDSGQYNMTFHDGSHATADAIVGCDGIKSRVRQLVLGEEHPQSRAHYSHKYAYRGLVPVEQAISIIGKENATSSRMYCGMNGHLVCFPISEGNLLNVVAFKEDPNPWADRRLVIPSNKEDAQKDFEDFGHTVRSIMDMLLEKLDCWAVFDTCDFPASTYCQGRVCIAGDAAHASSPHHGAGASMGIEDAAVMVGLLEESHRCLLESRSQHSRQQVLEAAFSAFDRARRERTQWLVSSSRLIGNVFEFRHPPCNDNPCKMEKELKWRHRKVWDADVRSMMEVANSDLKTHLQSI